MDNMKSYPREALPLDEDEGGDLKKNTGEPSQTNNFKIYLVALAIRLFIAIYFTGTYHKPDEYFQGPEVAHHMVFGTGELSWEWTLHDPIRNPVFPAFYAAGYLLLKMLGLDQILPLTSKFPHFQQAFLAALFDLLLLKINRHYNGPKSDHAIILFNWGGWVTMSYMSRTYANSFEAVINMAAFYFWLRREANARNDIYSRALVCLNFTVRTTSIVFWALLWPYQLLAYRCQSPKVAMKFILKNLITIVSMICCSVLVSLIYYHRLTWVDYNFFYYNVFLGWSTVAGHTPIGWYFTCYILKIFFSATGFLLVGFHNTFKPSADADNSKQKELKELFAIIISGMMFLSLHAHKELRFMLVYVPLLMVFAVKGFREFPVKHINLKRLLVVVFLGASIYGFVRRHFLYYEGHIEVAKYIRDNPNIKEVYYLISSYGLPMYSFIHRDIKIYQVQNPYAEAMLGRAEKDQYFQDPNNFFRGVINKYPGLTHVVTKNGNNQALKMELFPFDLEFEYVNLNRPDEGPRFKVWRARVTP